LLLARGVTEAVKRVRL